ncbi:MAG TPA: hypothetical protein VLL08_30325 [Kineosporiaceae bacterium]|nr:hypothetical protein [Kineosporiaceae bacterium]
MRASGRLRALTAAGVLSALALTLQPIAVPVAHSAAASSKVDRRIRDSRITESSGLATSRLHPGVLWTHNDSGNSPRIYAIGKDGSTDAALTLRGEPNVDWEAIATTTGKTGQTLLAIADIGDNNAVRSSVRIALVTEPQKLRTASVTPVRVLRLRYPGGPRDAEALLADPRDGRLYLVSKSLFGSELYAVPKSVWPGQAVGAGRVSPVTTMTKVASMSAGLITDGTFLPNGRMLLRGYGKVFVMDRPQAARNHRIATLADATLPAQEQGESITVTDDGRRALIGSEGRREPVLRIPVPTVPGDPEAADPTVTLPPDPAATEPTGTADQGGSRTSQSEPSFVGVGSRRVWTRLIGGGLAVIALTVGALRFRTRTRR